MAYQNISGGNVWKRPQYRNVFARDWQAGDSFKLDGTVVLAGGGSQEVQIVEATISEEDRAGFGPNDKLKAVLRIDFVKVNEPPVA